MEKSEFYVLDFDKKIKDSDLVDSALENRKGKYVQKEINNEVVGYSSFFELSTIVVVLYVLCFSFLLTIMSIGDIREDLAKRKLLGMKYKECFLTLFIFSSVTTFLSAVLGLLFSLPIKYLVSGLPFSLFFSIIFIIITFLFALLESLILSLVFYKKSVSTLLTQEVKEIC